MPDTPDPVASALDVIRAHSDLDGPRFNPNFTCDVHVPRLLAAVEAALKLADDWDVKAKKIGGQISLEDCDGATAGFKMIGYQNHRDHAEALREAIGAALTRKTATEAGKE